jgi:hypothetical protein
MAKKFIPVTVWKKVRELNNGSIPTVEKGDNGIQISGVFYQRCSAQA